MATLSLICAVLFGVVILAILGTLLWKAFHRPQTPSRLLSLTDYARSRLPEGVDEADVALLAEHLGEQLERFPLRHEEFYEGWESYSPERWVTTLAGIKDRRRVEEQNRARNTEDTRRIIEERVQRALRGSIAGPSMSDSFQSFGTAMRRVGRSMGTFQETQTTLRVPLTPEPEKPTPEPKPTVEDPTTNLYHQLLEDD